MPLFERHSGAASRYLIEASNFGQQLLLTQVQPRRTSLSLDTSIVLDFYFLIDFNTLESPVMNGNDVIATIIIVLFVLLAIAGFAIYAVQNHVSFFSGRKRAIDEESVEEA